jgi:hypothetical protein
MGKVHLLHKSVKFAKGIEETICQEPTDFFMDGLELWTNKI